MADINQSVAQGEKNMGALTDTERQTQAYNALKLAYGPAIAYNPENALNAANASAEMPLAPQAAQIGLQQKQATLESTQAGTQGKQIENQNTQNEAQRMAAYRAAAALYGTADQNGVVDPGQFDRLITPNAQLFGIDPDHVEPLKQMLSQPGGAQHLQSIMQSLIGPTKLTGAVTYGVDAQNNPVAITHDQYGNIKQVSLGGTQTTGQQNASAHTLTANTNAAMAPKKLAVQQQNANTNAFRANTTANNSAMGNPGGTLPQAGGTGGGPAGAAPANQPVGDPGAVFNRLPQGSKARQNAIGAASSIVNNGTQLRNTNILLDTVDKQITPYTAGTGTLLKDLPGTAQADLKANLKTLGAQGLTAWINSLKNSQGQTGIGRVLQSEANAAMTLFGNMEQDQSAKQLAFHAQLFRQAVNRLYQNQQNAYKQQYGVLPHEAAGTADPMQAAPPAGWKVIR